MAAIINFKLAPDEKTVLQSDCATWIVPAVDIIEPLDILILTNKRLVGSYTKGGGPFKEIPLCDIGVIRGKVLAAYIKHSEYGHCVQIQTSHGLELFTFDYKAKKTATEWAAQIADIVSKSSYDSV